MLFRYDALALAWPKDGKLRIRSLAADAGKVTAVSLLGHSGELTWTRDRPGPGGRVAGQKALHRAFALKIHGRQLRPSPSQTAPKAPSTPGCKSHCSRALVWQLYCHTGATVQLSPQQCALTPGGVTRTARSPTRSSGCA